MNMMNMKKHAVYGILAIVSLLGLGLTQSAKATPVLNAGFLYDEIEAANTNSLGSPYVFGYGFATTFSITDAFAVGDTYYVYDFGSLILTTTVAAGAPFATPGDPTGEAAWESGAYSIGSILLAPGLHFITVQGDCAAGCPAGFYDRLDVAVPDGGWTVSLLGFALVGLGMVRRKLGLGC